MRVLTVAICGLILMQTWAHAGEAVSKKKRTLTLKEACREAASANPGLSASRLTAAAAYARRKGVMARFWPQVTVAQEYTKTDNPGMRSTILSDRNESGFPTFADIMLDPDKPLLTERKDIENHRTQVQATWLIYDGGERSNQLRAAGREHAARRHDVKTVRGRLLSAVATAFLGALGADEEMSVAAAEVKRMDKRLAVAKKRKKHGRALETDVQAAEYHLASARHELLAARNALRDFRETLARLLGRKQAVTEKLTEGSDNVLARAGKLTDPRTAATVALKRSPELASALSQAAASRFRNKARNAAWHPRIEAHARYFFDGEDALDHASDQDSYVLGATLSWKLFDGGMRRARKLEARQLEAAADARAQDVARRVQLEAHARTRALNLALSAVEVAEKKLKLEGSEYKQAEAAHSGGRATFPELLEAQSELANARLSLVRSRHDARTAAARMLESLGVWAQWP